MTALGEVIISGGAPDGMLARPGASRMVVAGVIIAVLVVAGVGALLASGAMSSKGSSSPGETATISPTVSLSTSSASTGSTSSSSAPPSLAIGEFYADVSGPDLNQLNDNDSILTGSGSGGTVYLGNAGDSFTLEITLVYTNCQSGCPSEVASISFTQPGFTVQSTSPALPIAVDNPPGTPSSVENFQFTVTVVSPSTPYNGPLTVVSTVQ